MGKKRRQKSGYRHRGPDQPRPPAPDRVRVLPLFDETRGLQPGAAREIYQRTGVPEAEVWGTGSFYHLIARSGVEARVCDGLTCRLAGALDTLAALRARGVAAEACSCLGQCDRAPAVLVTPPADAEGAHGYAVAPGITAASVSAAVGEGRALLEALPRALPPVTLTPSHPELAIDLAGEEDLAWGAAASARELTGAEICAAVEASGLRGRGGAGFPAGIKWKAVAGEAATPRYVICNADEGEPGTFKDRAVLVRRPHLMLEGMAIAARAVGAEALIIYLRGEFEAPRKALTAAITEARARGHLSGLRVEIALGHGAYICGEETALLEALEGRRGMPRHKPPYPTQSGLHGQPTLMNNVETFACIPAILRRGPAWFAGLGRGDAAGTKLYSVSGHVARPGVYELPLGVTLRELIRVAGGVTSGALKAFSPGGASSGFLPASDADVPLDFAPLEARGSMLGSAGVVILGEEADMVRAALDQLRFFRSESCGQCAPCRIGTQVMVKLLERWAHGQGQAADFDTAHRVAWEMDAGSICGLGMTAPLPVVHLLRHFAEEVQVGLGSAPAVPRPSAESQESS